MIRVKYLQFVQTLKKNNLYRKPTNTDYIGDVKVMRDGRNLISFASNDYFGLAQNSLVKKAAIDAINKFGVGSGSSRYICGNNSLYEKLEKQIALMQKQDDAIVFSSGYAAAIGVIPALVGEGDLVIADKLIHSCLLDGVKLSGAKLMRFAHNNIKHARELLQNNTKKYQKILIITEEVFSMDGDLGIVDELQLLSAEFKALLLVDCAHSLYNNSSQAKNLIKLGTLSKAAGTLGGYVAADKITIDYLQNFARSAIYSTALPPAVLAASIQSLKIIAKKNPAKKLMQNVEYFCELMELSKPQSAIVVIKIGDNKKVLEIAAKIENSGFLISAIRPPTVEPKGARLRITFSSLHQKEQIKNLAKLLKKSL